jgi:hypothetical protein
MIVINKDGQFNALADNLFHSIYAWTFVHRVNILRAVSRGTSALRIAASSHSGAFLCAFWICDLGRSLSRFVDVVDQILSRSTFS